MIERTTRTLPGHFNAMAVCTNCNRDATQARMTQLVGDMIAMRPYRCDDCRATERGG